MTKGDIVRQLLIVLIIKLNLIKTMNALPLICLQLAFDANLPLKGKLRYSVAILCDISLIGLHLWVICDKKYVFFFLFFFFWWEFGPG